MCDNMKIDFDDTISIGIESDEEMFQNSYENYVFVDVQGFKTHNNRFICKEFCLIDGNDIFHALIKSPYKFERLSSLYRRQAQWLTRNYHGLSFDSGDMHIIEMKQKVFPKVCNKTILVKGDEKVNWLHYMFRDCGEINCANVGDLSLDYNFKFNSNDVCENHRKSSSQKQYVCAKSNALMLQNLANKNKNVEL